MKKLGKRLIAGLTAALGFLALLLKIKSQEASQAREGAAEAEAVAERAKANAELLDE